MRKGETSSSASRVSKFGRLTQLDAEGKFLVAEVAEGGSKDGDHGACEVGCGAMGESEAQEEMGEDGQGDELGEHADSVDGEAAEPFPEIVAVSAEDEMFVAEERHRDANGLAGDGGDDDSQGQVPVRQEMPVEEDECGIEKVGEDRVPDADQKITNDLRGWQHAAQAGKRTVRLRRSGFGDVGWGRTHRILEVFSL